MTDQAAAVRALLDKQEITELLTRYLCSVDGAWGIAHRQLLWDWNHDAPAAEHWMRGLLAPDLSVLRMSAKFPADPIYART
jgi:hypothetical protein